MAKKKLEPDHFDRGFGKVGWVYIARNNMHRDDVYKVGYTEKTPEQRVASLNTEQRNRTSQIGFFSLMYAVAVLDAQGCEQALFTRVERVLESERKEFVNAPLELIVGELLHIQKADNAKVQATRVCVNCKDLMVFCPLPQATLTCANCGHMFRCAENGDVIYAAKNDTRRKTYKPATQFSEKVKHSPLAAAYLRLHCALKNYAVDGIWTDDELLHEMNYLMAFAPALDREDYASRPLIEPRFAKKKPAKTPQSRKGWMDCPDCLSSIQLTPNEPAECTECGWVTPGVDD